MSWISEVYKEGLTFGFELKAKLFNGKSDFQRVEVAETTQHGRVLLCDGAFMLSERDERIYHEMITHVPLCVHPDPKKVLIIGGGDGGTAREVLRYQGVERVVMVEIDALVVEACRKFLPVTADALADSRLELKIEDGVTYMRDCQEQFDLILIDSTDPNGAAAPLFGPEFYANVKKCLATGGIVTAQGSSPFYEQEMQQTLLKIADPLFKYVSMYNFTNMTYPGGLWSFLWASNELHPLDDLSEKPQMDMFYYNSEVHKAAFRLPEFQAKALKPWTKI